MFGVDVKFFATSNFLIMAPVAVFLTFQSYPHDEMKFSYVVPRLGYSIYPVILVALAVLCMWHLWEAALRDPGIIPRRPVRTISGDGDDTALPPGWSRHFDKKEVLFSFPRHSSGDPDFPTLLCTIDAAILLQSRDEYNAVSEIVPVQQH